MFDRDFVAPDLAERAQSEHLAFTALTFRTEKPLDRGRFADAVRAMMPVVARAKGTLYFADAPGTRQLFQLSGARWTVKPLPASHAVPETRIVAIAFATTGARA